MAERINYPSMVTGLAALTGAGLYVLDDSGALNVDEAVTLASLGIVVGAAGVLRSAHSLVSRISQRSPD